MQAQFRRATARLSDLAAVTFPERRILIEDGKGQRSVKIGTHAQLMGLASAAMIAGWLTVSAVTGASTDNAQDVRTEAELARMAAQVQALKADTAALKGTVASAAERIESRQEFLDALLTGRARGADLAELLPRTARKVSSEEAAASGVLKPFAALEQKQLALVDKAAATAQTRLRDAETLLGRLGLNPSRFVAQSSANIRATGVGGPFVPASSNQSITGDTRFTELFVNWQRVEQLEDAMASLPSYVPARSYRLTSSYGSRYDPFNGRAASHAGLDMAGAHGEPIYSAANGRVVRASYFGAYGNTVDIDHGRGILTRYAHLSSIKVKVGDKVQMGDRIGGMGTTGRSTGTHLHYEVRIDGKPVNPRPFIEASNYLMAFKKESFGPDLAAVQ